MSEDVHPYLDLVKLADEALQRVSDPTVDGVHPVPDAAFDDVVEFDGTGALDYESWTDPRQPGTEMSGIGSPGPFSLASYFVHSGDTFSSRWLEFFTVTLWARPAALQAPSGKPEVILSGISGTQGWALVLDGRFKLIVGRYEQPLSLLFSTGSDDLWGTMDRWTHLALVVQGPRTGFHGITLYVDGEEYMRRLGSVGEKFYWLQNGGCYRLGGPTDDHRRSRPDDANFRGRLAKVRFRTGALDEAAIKKDRDDELNASPRAQAHLDDALVVHVSGASLTGERSPDDSGNGRDLRLPAGSACRLEQGRRGLFLPAGSEEATIPAPAVGLEKHERQLCFTVSAWFQVPDAAGAWQTVLRSAKAAVGPDPAWSIQVGEGKVRARLSWASGPASIELPAPASGWHFVALAVHTEENQEMVHASLYLDGQRTDVPAEGDFSLPDEVGLFAGDPAGSRTLGLADIRLVRHALSDQEIRKRRADDLAALPSPKLYSDPAGDGVRAVYPLDAVLGVDKLTDARGGAPAKLPGENLIVTDPAGPCLPLSGGSTAALPLPAAFLDPREGAQIGVSVWLRMLLHESAEPILLETGQDSTEEEEPVWALRVSTDRRLVLRSRDSDEVLDLGPAPASGEWFHLALSLVWSAGRLRAALWLDGAPAGEATAASSFAAVGERQQLRLGNHFRNYDVPLLEAAGLRVFDFAPDIAAVRAAMAADAPPRLAAQRALRSWLPLTEPENEDGEPPLTDTVASAPGSVSGSPLVVEDPWFHRCVSLGPGDLVRSSVGLPLSWQCSADGQVALWSLAFWVCPDAEALDADRILFSTDKDNKNFQLRAILKDQGDTLELRGGDQGSPYQPFCIKHEGHGLLRPERWCHIALGLRLAANGRRSFNKEWCLFIDGQERELTSQDQQSLESLKFWHQDHRPGRSGGGGWSPMQLALGDSSATAGSVRYADSRIAGRLPDAGPVQEWIRNAESTNFLPLEEANRTPLADLPLDQLHGDLFEDASGHGRSGWVEADTPVTVVEDRHVGLAADYAGEPAPGTIHLQPIFKTASGRAVTVEVWVKSYLPPGADPAPLISGIQSGEEAWALLVGKNAKLRCHDGESVTGPAIARSRWQHLAMVLEEVLEPSASRTAHLYLDGEPAGSCAWEPVPVLSAPAAASQQNGITFGALAAGAGEVVFEGRLANLRIFDRALSAVEIADAFAARKPGPLPATSHHLEFALHDSRREAALYLMDGPQPMALDLTNASPAELTLPLLPGTPDPDEHHFELRFRAGVLRDLEKIAVTGPELPGVTWKLAARDTPGTDYAVSLFLTATGDAGGSVQLAPQASWSFALANVTPEPGGGTRGTRVQLRWRNCRSAAGETLVGTRLHYLHLVHGRKPSAVAAFPLHARLVGAPLVPTGTGSTDASLELAIVHDEHLELPMPASPDPELAPAVQVSIPDALSGSDVAFAVDQHPSGRWELRDTGSAAELLWQGNGSATAGGVEELDAAAFGQLKLTATGLDPGSDTGTAWVVVRFVNFPDLDNPGRTLPDIVQRVPIVKAPVHLAEKLPAAEALAVDGSLGLWNGGLRLHGSAWTAGEANADQSEASLEWNPANGGGLEVSSKKTLALQAQNGDVSISAGMTSGTSTTWKTTTFGSDGRVTMPGTLEVGEVRQADGDVKISAGTTSGGTTTWKTMTFGKEGRVTLPESGEVRSDKSLLVQAHDSKHQLRLRMQADGSGPGDLTELREYGEVRISAGVKSDDSTTWKTTTFGDDGQVTLPGDLEVAHGRIRDRTGQVMPVGAILAYGGSQAPTGWLLCDGSEITGADKQELRNLVGPKTPDLRSRFVVGAGQGANLSQYSVHARGGEEMHLLTVDEMPAHRHKINNGDFGLHHRSFEGESTAGRPFRNDLGQTEGGTETAGKSMAHENRPPYYALTYIIKY